jgi:acyl-CoA hydrolase
MQGNTIDKSGVTMSQPMMPSDANPSGHVHGGTIMKTIDLAGGLVALRHARMNVVTASVDRIDFLNPVHIGDVLFLKATLSSVGKTSMHVNVLVPNCINKPSDV